MPWVAREEIVKLLREMADEIEAGVPGPGMRGARGHDGRYTLGIMEQDGRVLGLFQFEYDVETPEVPATEEP